MQYSSLCDIHVLLLSLDKIGFAWACFQYTPTQCGTKSNSGIGSTLWSSMAHTLSQAITLQVLQWYGVFQKSMTFLQLYIHNFNFHLYLVFILHFVILKLEPHPRAAISPKSFVNTPNNYSWSGLLEYQVRCRWINPSVDVQVCVYMHIRIINRISVAV